MFCGYANGVFAYVRQIAARTEQYWCPIRHARGIRAPHAHDQRFVEFGDAEGYRRRLPVLRAELAPAEARPPGGRTPTDLRLPAIRRPGLSRRKPGRSRGSKGPKLL